MSITTTKYVRKPLFVDAVRIAKNNFYEVAAWCQGEIRKDDVSSDSGTGKEYIKIRVHNPINPRQTKAFIGDWLLYTEKGYKIYTNAAFRAAFDESSTVEKPLSYPYDGGGITVLGPEVFAQPDGEVLCWKGVNYVRQDSILGAKMAGSVEQDISNNGNQREAERVT